MHSRLLPLSIAAALLLPVGAYSQDSTLDKAKQSGTFTISYRDSSIPFSYLDDKGEPVGFAYEVCQRIADNVKKAIGNPDLKVNKQLVTSANRIPLLINGTIDVECGSTTNNAERAKQVDFGINYFYTGTRFLVKKGVQIKGIADLKGKTVVSTTGTTNLRLIRNLSEEQNLNINLLGAKDHAEAALMTASGRAVAFGMDDILLYGLKAAMPSPDDWAVEGEAIQVEPYAVMVRKNDPAFKKVVDATLTGMMTSGEFTKLYQKWFDSAIPPKGINLHAPMSAELKANLVALSDKPSH